MKKRKSWKVQRTIYNALSRELAQLAVPQSVPRTRPVKAARAIRPPAQPKADRPKREMTEREAAIHTWYFYGEADDPPPEGITEAELMNVRSRFH